MFYALGIDIGTSFTAAAVVHTGTEGEVRAETLPLGTRGPTVPSVIFLGDDGHVLVGEAAERRAATHPLRLVREFKRRIGDAIPLVVEELSVSAEDIFATVARWVVDRAEEREGTHPDIVCISHPANWGSYKTGLVREALAGVGLADVVLVSEPEAAALHYAARERVDAGSSIAVYDLGGGTFDVAVLRKTAADSFEVVGAPAGIDRLGGADFDEAVFRHVTAGLGDAYTSLDITDPAVLVAIGRLRRECTEAKENLSFDSQTCIPVLLPGLSSQVRLVRDEFEELIERPVHHTVGFLRRSLEEARVEASSLTSIVLIGGSSRIPLITELLSAEFDLPIAVDADPKAAISLGAAAAAASALAARSSTPADTETEAAITPVLAPSAGTARASSAPTGDRSDAVTGSAGRGPAHPHFASKRAAAPVAVETEADETAARRSPLSRTSVRVILAAAAAGVVVVLAGTAPNTSLETLASAADALSPMSAIERTVDAVMGSPEATGGETASGESSGESDVPGAGAGASDDDTPWFAPKTSDPKKPAASKQGTPDSPAAQNAPAGPGTPAGTPGTTPATSAPAVNSETPVTPVTPVDTAPVDPTPVDPAPVDPTPVDPTPVDPTPVDPTPVDPTPVDPEPEPAVDPPSDPAPSSEPAPDSTGETATPEATLLAEPAVPAPDPAEQGGE
jgi:actin-like ATPase involved in cell morphogenesis